jgi:hypothetical protein
MLRLLVSVVLLLSVAVVRRVLGLLLPVRRRLAVVQIEVDNGILLP